MIRLLSANDESLFVARRTLRDLVRNEQALRLEALVHGARMQALMELHEIDDYNVSSEEMVEKISRFLMIRDGKLVDDLENSDDRIRAWVSRLADAKRMAALRQERVAMIRGVFAETKSDDDRLAARLIELLLMQDADEGVARVAAEVLATGYLDQQPQLRLE